MKRRRAARQIGRKPLVSGWRRGFDRSTFADRARIYAAKKGTTGCRCEQCKAQCRKPGGDKSEGLPAPFIVHIDGRANNMDTANLYLVCEGCYWRDHHQQIHKPKR